MFTLHWILILAYCLSLPLKVHSQQEEETDPWSEYERGELGQYPQVTYKTTRLSTPQIHTLKSSASCDTENHVLISPHAGKTEDNKIMMLDSKGNLVWFLQEKGSVHNVQVQQYKGKDFITYWIGDDENQFWKHGAGYYKMLDSTYTLMYTVQAVGIDGDYHEFSITPQNTAVVTAYVRTPWNLTAYGREDGYIWDCVFQEIDIASGELLFEWHASDHFKFDQMAIDSWSSWTGRFDDPWDWFHLSSVQKDGLGNYLISAHFTNAIHYISGKSGKKLWQLGGVRQQNTFFDTSLKGLATKFDKPQMARLESASNQTHTVLTVFATTGSPDHRVSQGLKIVLDLAHRTATLLTTFTHPSDHLARSGGSLQYLPESGNYLLGYGRTPVYSEYSSSGELLCDTHIAPVSTGSTTVETYRIYASRWKGFPLTTPVVIREADAFHIHWNGATELASWLLEGGGGFGHRTSKFQPLGVHQIQGFETRIPLQERSSFTTFRLTARDDSNKVLGVWTIEQGEIVKDVVYFSHELLPNMTFLSLLGVIVLVIAALLLLLSRSDMTKRVFNESLSTMHKLLDADEQIRERASKRKPQVKWQNM